MSPQTWAWRRMPALVSSQQPTLANLGARQPSEYAGWIGVFSGLVITIRSRQPKVVLDVTLLVGALGGMIDVICVGFYLSDLAALFGAMFLIRLMAYLVG